MLRNILKRKKRAAEKNKALGGDVFTGRGAGEKNKKINRLI